MIKLKHLLKTIKFIFIISASIHMLILIPHSILTYNIETLNFFDIIDIDLLYPDIAIGTTNFVVSMLVFTVFFYSVYFFVSKEKKTNSFGSSDKSE